MEELHGHAAAIADMLANASARVELLAASDARAPDLVDAIRQEITLSRRWNQHLGTILQNVAEARRALAEREREAAREIARMTAVAEEARLELVALKKVLKGQPAEATERRGGRSDSGRQTAVGRQMASNPSVADVVTRGIAGPMGDLDDARATLAAVEDAQISAFRDVDAVRAKIIDALQILSAAHGDKPINVPSPGERLSSEDITGWAASMATRLNRASRAQAD